MKSETKKRLVCGLSAAALIFFAGLMPAEFTAPDPSGAASAASMPYEIPAMADAGDFYTEEIRRQMAEAGLHYYETEALRSMGYSLSEMLRLPRETVAALTACSMMLTESADIEQLLRRIPAYITGLPDYMAWIGYPGALVPQIEEYGYSVLGRALYAIRLTPENPSGKKMILTYAIHGYEGLAASDGAYLSEQACRVALFYSLYPQYLNGTELLILPMLNPDGVYYRTGESVKYGRGQSQGIDMNRDFLSGRFSAQESRALRDLIQREAPDILIDFHGWLEESYGDSELAGAFQKHMGIELRDTSCGTQQGYLAGYAKARGITALLVEHSGIYDTNTPKMIFALNEIMGK